MFKSLFQPINLSAMFNATEATLSGYAGQKAKNQQGVGNH